MPVSLKISGRIALTVKINVQEKDMIADVLPSENAVNIETIRRDVRNLTICRSEDGSCMGYG